VATANNQNFAASDPPYHGNSWLTVVLKFWAPLVSVVTPSSVLDEGCVLLL